MVYIMLASYHKNDTQATNGQVSLHNLHVSAIFCTTSYVRFCRAFWLSLTVQAINDGFVVAFTEVNGLDSEMERFELCQHLNGFNQIESFEFTRNNILNYYTNISFTKVTVKHVLNSSSKDIDLDSDKTENMSKKLASQLN